jgi:uncharacterized protein (TIGR04222 family)
MDWLIHNLVADMYGPLFLFFYGCIVILTFIACKLMLSRVDYTALMPAPPVPANPDPYEIAYLRGGENETVRAVVFDLIRRNFLQINRNTGLIQRVAAPPDRHQLPALPRRVFDWFVAPHEAGNIFKAGGLASQIKPFCVAYEQRLQDEKFLTPADVRAAARKVMLIGLLNVIALGGYKLFVALAKGHRNVGFLLVMVIAAVVAIAVACRVPRLSKRGALYLERLRSAFERLIHQPRARTAAEMNSLDPTLPLLVGVFGVTVLAGTPYDYYQQTFRQASSGGSSCGSSCGSSSCGGGGGCGGGGCGGCS